MNNGHPPLLFADFNNGDPQGRLRLNCAGTMHDLSNQGIQLVPGLAVVLSDDELEADGIVQFSEDESIWVAAIDWNRIRKRANDKPAVSAGSGGAT